MNSINPCSDSSGPEAQAPQAYLALHTLGWKAFQDLCAQVCEVVLGRTVVIYREAQDGGQDATFTSNPRSITSETESATIQCKFSGDPGRKLRPSDIAGERLHIKSLVSRGLASSYYFMTNMSVDAPVAADIRKELSLLGVRDSQVFGREWLTLKIRESAKLRALVPRIYGLGDLSMILDERRAQQTGALLGHLMPSLRTYVPTTAHRQAVRILSETGIVLLVGPPASGKSMIAAILATTALGGEGHQTFQLDGPGELTEFWNPSESGRFYWIDDAFGPNQLRSDYVDYWIAAMNKVKTALNAGNRFVLTSRLHIWREAKLKLGIRNHQKLADESAVVNVGALSPDERAQILYNHIKVGNQPRAQKSRFKPHLAEIASSSDLLPEIARRLGDPSYTSGVRALPSDLTKFVSAPKEFLKETLRELTDAQRAALTVIFLFRSKLPAHIGSDSRISLVCDKYGVRHGDVNEALSQLDGSFILQKPDGNFRIWTFAHPTIADALADILRDRPDLLQLYIQGARVEVLLSEAVCDGAAVVQDAIVIPESSNDLLVVRIVEMADEVRLNKVLFSFLALRASDAVLRQVFSANPSIIRRKSESAWRIRADGRVRTFARLHKLGLLPEDLREDVSRQLEDALLHHQDASLLDYEDLLALLTPYQLLGLSTRIYEDLVDEMPDRINSIEHDADLNLQPSENFDQIKEYVESIASVFSDSNLIVDAISTIQDDLADAIGRVAERQEREFQSGTWVGDDIAPRAVVAPVGGRSMFSDVDF
ncbi:MAG: hypothetical protein H4O13_05850 [Xanthomonadales bacterium]|nr:hypothetical protein [Xanthomonadales bacterium]